MTPDERAALVERLLSGEMPTGVCHCGTEIGLHSVADGHNPVEMLAPFPASMDAAYLIEADGKLIANLTTTVEEDLKYQRKIEAWLALADNAPHGPGCRKAYYPWIDPCDCWKVDYDAAKEALS